MHEKGGRIALPPLSNLPPPPLPRGNAEGERSDEGGDSRGFGHLLNAIADFAWVGNTLTVTFSQVPEPAAVAALIGAFALGVAAWRRRR